MLSFTGNKYPEELRALRAQYPNTQFDSHGRVVGGMPLDQYNAQPANPAAIPASIRTYSQFDPATGTWIRHTNGVASPVQGMTPTNTPGIYLRPREQPARQVMRPLARGNARDVSAAVAPRDLGSGVTAQEVGTYDYSKTHGNENPVAPLTQPGVVYSPARNLEGYDPNNPGITPNQNVPLAVSHAQTPTAVISDPDGTIATEIGQSVPSGETTPKLNMSDYKPYGLWGNIGTAALIPAEIAATAATSGLGIALNGARALPHAATAVRAINYGRNLGNAASASAKASSRLGGVRDAVTGLYNKAGGFLRREHTPAANFTVDAAGNVQATSPYTTNVIGDALRNGYQTVRGWFTR